MPKLGSEAGTQRLLPDADHANALTVGEALRAGVTGAGMVHPTSPEEAAGSVSANDSVNVAVNVTSNVTGLRTRSRSCWQAPYRVR